MPIFAPGAEVRAKIAISNLQPVDLICDVSLFLGSEDVAQFKEATLQGDSTTELQTPVVVLPSVVGIYPVYIRVYLEGSLIGTYPAEDVVIAVPMPSALLIQYQYALSEAYLAVEGGYPGDWVMIPGYGLQYASAAIPQLIDLMTVEAIAIGMIASSADRYFVRDVMYFNDGTTIVPYWWPCQYCEERFRSPALRDAHIVASHVIPEAVIVQYGFDSYCWDYPFCDDIVVTAIFVTWRNDSDFNVQGHIDLAFRPTFGGTYYFTSPNVVAAPGQVIRASWPWDGYGQFASITLTVDGFVVDVKP